MKRLLIAISTMIAVLLPATSAAAWPRDVPWNYAPCFESVIDYARVDTSAKYSTLMVYGAATLCGPTVPNGGFRLATYQASSDSGLAQGYNVRQFDSEIVGSMRYFGAAAALTGGPGRLGICFLGAGSQRVSCSLLTIDASRHVTVESLATDDPLVTKGVMEWPYTGQVTPFPSTADDPTGNCGTCF